ncbi:MAG: alpha-E domain-containing protein [Magnetococcales bacterium]|nr:alpha-E domain-containing protein [Magnetococcales bacterium]
MLSRVAENIYWMGRYLERAENIARLVSVTSTLLLDQPGVGPEQGWRRLVIITGCDAAFAQTGQRAGEEAVTRFLLSESDNVSSLFSSVAYARENLRAMRDSFPGELWEGLNDLSLFLKEQGEKGVEAAYRHDFLGEVIGRCQTLVGILVGTLSRGPAFDFFSMGQHMERADMCTRILDVDVATGHPTRGGMDLLWLNLLRSVSGEPMYRRHVNPRVNAVDVVSFLLRDRRFPRAFNFCLYEVERCLNTLDHNALSVQLLKRMERRVDTQDVATLIETGPALFMDELQQELQKLHRIITAIYF